MNSLFQMLTIIGVVGLIVYLFKEQDSSEQRGNYYTEKKRDYYTPERPRITYRTYAEPPSVGVIHELP